MNVLELLARCAGWDGVPYSGIEKPQSVTILETYQMTLGSRSIEELIKDGGYDSCKLDVPFIKQICMPGIADQKEVYLLKLENHITMYDENVLLEFGYKFATLEMLLIWGALRTPREIRTVNIGGANKYCNARGDERYRNFFYIIDYTDAEKDSNISREISEWYPYSYPRCTSFTNRYVLAVKA